MCLFWPPEIEASGIQLLTMLTLCYCSHLKWKDNSCFLDTLPIALHGALRAAGVGLQQLLHECTGIVEGMNSITLMM
jgi:hypothetical protein